MEIATVHPLSLRYAIRCGDYAHPSCARTWSLGSHGSGIRIGGAPELRRHFASSEERSQEQHAEHEIDETEAEDDRVHPAARVENQHRHTEREFLEHGQQHQRAIAFDVSRDQEKNELPDERETDETIEVLRIPDRFRERESRARFGEVLRRQDENSVDRGEQEHSTREFGVGEHPLNCAHTARWTNSVPDPIAGGDREDEENRLRQPHLKQQAAAETPLQHLPPVA